MFSSNIGFRRRTASEGSNQLFQSAPAGQRGTGTSYRHSLDEAAAIKRVVLRKHSGESAGSRGLADRIARSEVEDIGGFWSRRLSGQKRSVPPSPKQADSSVSGWRIETRPRDETLISNTGKLERRKSKPGGPRPLPNSPSSRRSSYQVPSVAIPLGAPPKVASVSPLNLKPVSALPRSAALSQLTAPSSQSLTRTKVYASSKSSTADRSRDPNVVYRPLLPPGLPNSHRSTKSATKPKAEAKEDPNKEKDKKRFAQFELKLGKLLVLGNFGSKKALPSQSQPTTVMIFSEKHREDFGLPLLPPLPLSVPLFPPASIPIPPMPPMPPIPPPPPPEALPPIYRARAHAVQLARQSIKSLRRKSSRKRKTGLAKIVVELAKGGQVTAVDAEAIQEAAEVNAIMAQLRQMKAA